MSMSILSSEFKRISVDQLPSFTNWPQILIESKEDVLFFKTKNSILREYEYDKWGMIYKEIKNKNVSIDNVDEMQFKDPRKHIPCSVGTDLFVAPPLSVKLLLVDIINNAISEVMSEGDPIVELGVGAGSIILRLAMMDKYKKSNFYATDFSNSSLKIVGHLADLSNIKINLQLLDFNSEIFDISIPKKSIIYISFALCLIENLSPDFWRKIAALQPKAIILAEPIFEFYEDDTILTLLRRRYYSANQYGNKVYSSIIKSSTEKVFAIKKITKNVIGINPLVPVSLIELG